MRRGKELTPQLSVQWMHITSCDPSDFTASSWTRKATKPSIDYTSGILKSAWEILQIMTIDAKCLGGSTSAEKHALYYYAGRDGNVTNPQYLAKGFL